MGLIKCQDIGVGLDLLSVLSNGNFFVFVLPDFPRAAVISIVAKANFLLLTTPLEEFNLSWGYALLWSCGSFSS